MSGKGKGKGKAIQKRTKVESSSSSSSSSSGSSTPAMVVTPELSHFDEHFKTIQCVAEQIEPIVNMKVYGHGSWCAIAKILEDGFVSEEQECYFKKHLKEKGDVDIIILFDDDLTGDQSSKQKMLENEKIIFNKLKALEQCQVSRVDLGNVNEPGKFYKFEFVYAGSPYDLEMASQDSNDHSLSPASVMFDKDRNPIFGKKHEHQERHRRFLSHQEIHMPGLTDYKPSASVSVKYWESVRVIAYAIKSALFYIGSSKEPGYYVTNDMITQLKNYKDNPYLWKDVRKFYNDKYFTKNRVAMKIDEALVHIEKASRYPDLCRMSRQQVLAREWDKLRLSYLKTMSIIEDLNQRSKTKLESPFSSDIMAATRPGPTNVSYDEQVTIIFEKIEVLKKSQKEAEAQYEYYSNILKNKIQLKEGENNSPSMSVSTSSVSSHEDISEGELSPRHSDTSSSENAGSTKNTTTETSSDESPVRITEENEKRSPHVDISEDKQSTLHSDTSSSRMPGSDSVKAKTSSKSPEKKPTENKKKSPDKKKENAKKNNNNNNNKNSNNSDDEFDLILQSAQASNAAYLKKKAEIASNARDRMFQLLLAGDSNVKEINEKTVAASFRGKSKSDDKITIEGIKKSFDENRNVLVMLNAILKRADFYESDMQLLDSHEIPDQFFYEVMNDIRLNVDSFENKKNDKKFSISDAYFNQETETQKANKIIKGFADDLEVVVNKHAQVESGKSTSMRVQLVRFFIKKYKTLKIVIKNSLHLDAISYVPNPKNVMNDMKRTNELLEGFLKQYVENKDKKIVDEFQDYANKKGFDVFTKMRAYMRILFTYLEFHEKNYSEIIDMYVEYMRREKNNPYLVKRDEEIEFFKNVMSTSLAGKGEIPRVESVKSIVASFKHESGWTVSPDRIMCGIFEEAVTISDTMETFEQLVPECFRTGLYYQDEDRNEEMVGHPSVISLSLTEFISNNSVLPMTNDPLSQYNNVMAYLKGALLMSERLYYKSIDPRKSNGLLNMFKYFYFLVSEISIKNYAVLAKASEINEFRRDDKNVSALVNNYLADKMSKINSDNFSEWKEAFKYLIDRIQRDFVHFDMNRIRIFLKTNETMTPELRVWFDLAMIHYLEQNKIIEKSSIVYPVTDPENNHRLVSIGWLFTAIEAKGKFLIQESDIFVEKTAKIYAKGYERVGMKFSPFIYIRGFAQNNFSDGELIKFIDVIFTYSTLLMLFDCRNDFRTVTTFSNHLICSLESFALDHFYREKFNKGKPELADVNAFLKKVIRIRQLYNQSFRRLLKIYLTLPLDQISGLYSRKCQNGSSPSEKVEFKAFLFTYAITFVQVNACAVANGDLLDVISFYVPFQNQLSDNLYESLESVMQNHEPVIQTIDRLIMLEILSAYLKRMDPNWQIDNSTQKQIQMLYDLGVARKNSFDGLKAYMFSSLQNRPFVIKSVIYFMRVNRKKELDEILPMPLINKLLELSENITEDDVNFITLNLFCSYGAVTNHDPNLQNHRKMFWEADLIYAVYLMKIDEFVLRDDYSSEKKKENLDKIRSLHTYSRKTFKAGEAMRNDEARATGAPSLIAAPTVQGRQQLSGPSSVSQEAVVKKTSGEASPV